MSATIVAACWAAVVLSTLTRRFPVRTAPSRSRPEPVKTLGGALRTSPVLRRIPDLDDADDTPLGRTVVAGAVVALLQPVLAGLVVVVGCVLIVARARRRQQLVLDDPLALSTVIDLLVVATTAGLDARRSIGAVAHRVDAPFDDSFASAVAALEAGGGRDTAWHHALAPAGPRGRHVASAIRDTERDGTSIRATLMRASADLALQGRREAEQRARRLPIRLLFPLVSCILPAFALLTVVPLLAGSVGSLPF